MTEKTINCLLYFVMYHTDYVRKSDNFYRVVNIGEQGNDDQKGNILQKQI